MNSHILSTVGAVLLIPSAALAQTEPAAAPPQQQVTPDPYTDLNKQVQEKLRAMGLYTGPVNGDIGPNTQAALAQFQLSIPLPASGTLDPETLAALGLEPSGVASAGASGDTAGSAQPQAVPPAEGGSAEASVKAN